MDLMATIWRSQPETADTAIHLGATIGERLGLAPVSYTHLRAHETVLDLVCRLLLEKKKNHLPSTTDT